MQHSTDYSAELRSIYRQRTQPFLLANIAMMLLLYFFAQVLYRVTIHYLSLVLISNLLGLVLLLVINNKMTSGTWAHLIGFIGYLLATQFFFYIIYFSGKTFSLFFPGLVIALALYSAFLPIEPLQTLFNGLLAFAAYAITFFIVSRPASSAATVTGFSNLFFLAGFVAIAVIQSYAETNTRRAEFQLRKEEHEAVAEIEEQAKSLEQKVAERAEELQRADSRFHTLYESMVDAVLLVRGDGGIIQANKTWLDTYARGVISPRTSFFDACREHDWQTIKTELLDAISSGRTVYDWHCTLYSSQGLPIDVEISGVLLFHDSKKIGIQLLVRDIGVRKKLESEMMDSLGKVRKIENMTILALAKISEYRDQSPGNHLERIREYCRILAQDVSSKSEYKAIVTPLFIQMLYQGSVLHDIGKVAISDHILAKTSDLTEEELLLYQSHTVRGNEFIQQMEAGTQSNSFLTLARNIALFHHERWDGKGYPQGLSGKAIPLEARIMALADYYEELTVNHRGTSLDSQQAAQAIFAASGKRLDPLLVNSFSFNLDSFDRVRQNFEEAP